jgi:hypothetical protein
VPGHSRGRPDRCQPGQRAGTPSSFGVRSTTTPSRRSSRIPAGKAQSANLGPVRPVRVDSFRWPPYAPPFFFSPARNRYDTFLN